jgi:hypothetical protein
MPEEFSRTTKRKRIILPTGGAVNVPIITKIAFIDPYDRYQEWQHSIDNSSESARIVHTDQLHPSSGSTANTSISLPIERIDQWPSVDPFDRYQETHLELDNVTGSDSIPPSFITHLKTHVVRYTGTGSSWIDSELIDSFAVVDPYDRYQEKIYTLNNPQTSEDAQADPSDPEISDTGNGVDPPWRTDPFQNIINYSNAGGIAVSWGFFRDDQGSPIITSATWSIISRTIGGAGTSIVVITSDPTVTPSTFSPSASSFARMSRSTCVDPPMISSLTCRPSARARSRRPGTRIAKWKSPLERGARAGAIRLSQALRARRSGVEATQHAVSERRADGIGQKIRPIRPEPLAVGCPDANTSDETAPCGPS